jgi:hypothetical protein
MGWSNGAFLTAGLIRYEVRSAGWSKPIRFKRDMFAMLHRKSCIWPYAGLTP